MLALAGVSPSRSLYPAGESGISSDVVTQAYNALAINGITPSAGVSQRLYNKLAYAFDPDNTIVQITFFHPNSEPPLWIQTGELYPYQMNEIGWQDTITVKVTYNLALLPGPGRLLAGKVRMFNTGAPIKKLYGEQSATGATVYKYPIKAWITLGNEGEKSLVPYVYQ